MGNSNSSDPPNIANERLLEKLEKENGYLKEGFAK